MEVNSFLLSSGNETQVTRLSDKDLYLMSHLVDPRQFSFLHTEYFLSAKHFAFLSHGISMTTHFTDEAKAHGEEIIV